MKISQKKEKELVALFDKEIYNRLQKIDPRNKHNLISLALGWALAKNLPFRNAYEFALHIRYIKTIDVRKDIRLINNFKHRNEYVDVRKLK